jgi:hypothetical protein
MISGELRDHPDRQARLRLKGNLLDKIKVAINKAVAASARGGGSRLGLTRIGSMQVSIIKS